MAALNRDIDRSAILISVSVGDIYRWPGQKFLESDSRFKFTASALPHLPWSPVSNRFRWIFFFVFCHFAEPTLSVDPVKPRGRFVSGGRGVEKPAGPFCSLHTSPEPSPLALTSPLIRLISFIRPPAPAWVDWAGLGSAHPPLSFPRPKGGLAFGAANRNAKEIRGALTWPPPPLVADSQSLPPHPTNTPEACTALCVYAVVKSGRLIGGICSTARPSLEKPIPTVDRPFRVDCRPSEVGLG